VKIVLPVIEGETVFNAVELQGGEVVPLSGHEHDELWIYLPKQHDEEELPKKQNESEEIQIL
jgi:hypothetical protein